MKVRILDTIKLFLLVKNWNKNKFSECLSLWIHKDSRMRRSLFLQLSRILKVLVPVTLFILFVQLYYEGISVSLTHLARIVALI